MKLLLDANITPALIGRLRSQYPDGMHVRDAGLRQASDGGIWDDAKVHDFVVVSRSLADRLWEDAAFFGPDHGWEPHRIEGSAGAMC